MTTKFFFSNLLLLYLCAFAGCSRKDSGETDKSVLTSPTDAEATLKSDDPAKASTPNYGQMFDVLVRGTHPKATEEQMKASDKVVEEIFHFPNAQKQAFLELLHEKLSDVSPFARMEAAFHIAVIRIDLGIAEQNKDLIPTYVELLQHDDFWVRNLTLNGLHAVVEQPQLEEELRPLVKPLIATAQDARTAYKSISALGAIGPVAMESIPAIRLAAENGNDEIIDEVAKKAIRKIEGR